MIKNLKLIEGLNIYKAIQDDWKTIINILEETGLIIGLCGDESFNDFYIIKSLETISCFAIYKKNDIGLLKYFAIKNNFQRKGLGRYIVENMIMEVAKEKNIKKLYLMAGKREPFTSYNFWEKTSFRKILLSSIEDIFFKNYAIDLKSKFPQYFDEDSAFIYEL